MNDKDGDAEQNVNRRRVLKGAGVVAAGAAGAVVAGAVAATPAHAAAGGNAILGVANDAGASPTGVTAAPTADRETLELANTTTFNDANGVARGGAPLRLVPNPNADFISDSAPVGSVGVGRDGTMWTVVTVPGQPGQFRAFTFTDFNANFLVALNPDRVIDTRGPGARGRILNPQVLDGIGRVVGGNTINIDLSDYTVGATAVFVNITAVQPTGNGFLTAFATGSPQPPVSNVNYSGGQFAVPNFAVVPGGVAQVGAEFHDAISVFTAVTTHVIVDITAVQVPSIAQVNPAHLPGGAAAPNQLRAQAVRKLSKPSWYKGQS